MWNYNAPKEVFDFYTNYFLFSGFLFGVGVFSISPVV